MDAHFRTPWIAVIGIAGVAILSAALFAARHGKALMAFAL
jgi:glycine/D-amino acid oxidase-like deaminating enzyme